MGASINHLSSSRKIYFSCPSIITVYLKLSQEERRTRSHRLVVRGAVFESIVPEAKTMTDEEAAAFLRLALTSEEARGYLKKRTEGGKSE